jgi:hypothetical protein
MHFAKRRTLIPLSASERTIGNSVVTDNYAPAVAVALDLHRTKLASKGERIASAART